MSDPQLLENGRIRPRGKPFEKGNQGRKPGSKNKVTLVIAGLLEDQAEALLQKAFELAMDGDKDMLKFLLGRVLPKDRIVKLDLPPVRTREEAMDALAVVATAVSTGEITASEAASLGTMIASSVRTIDVATDLPHLI